MAENPTPPDDNPPEDPKPPAASRRRSRPKPGAIVRLDDPKDKETEPRLAIVVDSDADGVNIVELPAARRHELDTYPVE